MNNVKRPSDAQSDIQSDTQLTKLREKTKNVLEYCIEAKAAKRISKDFFKTIFVV